MKDGIACWGNIPTAKLTRIELEVFEFVILEGFSTFGTRGHIFVLEGKDFLQTNILSWIEGFKLFPSKNCLFHIYYRNSITEYLPNVKG